MNIRLLATLFAIAALQVGVSNDAPAQTGIQTASNVVQFNKMKATSNYYRASSANLSSGLPYQTNQLIGNSKGGAGASQGPRTLNMFNEGAFTPPTSPQRQSATYGVGNAGGVVKPFSSAVTAPTVSPYLRLFDQNFGGNDGLNYQNYVKPAIQQQQFNNQVIQQSQAINRRLTALSARNAFNTTGDENIMPTGHSATFLYNSHFYPRMAPVKKSR